ncbi:helix-turn-helix domain-containing protein [Halomicronema hongdechloris]|nr:helix-turn-helix domain-containing protein [Halomicronema hongdechloris]
MEAIDLDDMPIQEAAAVFHISRDTIYRQGKR